MECHWRSRWANVTARVETIERQPPAGILRYRYKARNQPESTGKTAGSNFRSKNDKDIFRPKND